MSTNRELSRHRVRYVEVGGNAVDEGECVFCNTTPEPASSQQGNDPEPGQAENE
ncbi:MAG: hypothetical protein R3276_06325 [Marinobacter sp.]|nr:hypothetical protein [Marinobacter sp.]